MYNLLKPEISTQHDDGHYRTLAENVNVSSTDLLVTSEMIHVSDFDDCFVSAEPDTCCWSWTIFFACRRSGMSIMLPRNVNAPYKYADKYQLAITSLYSCSITAVSSLRYIHKFLFSYLIIQKSRAFIQCILLFSRFDGSSLSQSGPL